MANVDGIGWYAGWVAPADSPAVTDSGKTSSQGNSFADQFSAQLTAAPAVSILGSRVGTPSPLAQNSTLGTSSSTPEVPVDGSPASEADAYWAQQPEAVQALRTMTDPNERQNAALDLANKGYTIDYQTMVLGWDPLNVMSIRQFYGYTWVPSMLQPPVSGMPGSNLPGLPVYDPGKPPAGSIKVSTDFAIGKTVPSWEAYNAVTGPSGNAKPPKTVT